MNNLFPLLPLLLAFLAYPLAAGFVLHVLPRRLRAVPFAILNVGGAAALGLLAAFKGVRLKQALQFAPLAAGFFGLYLAVVLIQYVNLRRASREEPAAGWPAYVFPLAALGFIKYVPPSLNPLQSLLTPHGDKHLPELFIGISYMAFRLTYLVQEVRNDVARMPSVAEYLSFAFFVPTLTIGPINPYREFQRSLDQPDRRETPRARSFLRILVGLTKYLFLANLFNQLSYSGLLLDGHRHPPIDLVLAVFAYSLYLYSNFSGYCDLAIGVSGLLGIRVVENFNDPFGARNLQEFWNRWHVSLSTYTRDLMFSPLSKALVRRFGPASADHLVAVSIFCVFLAVGVWHGAGWNHVIFGAWNGVGLVTVHYYTAMLKRRLGKAGYARYRDNRWIEAAATAVTFTYFSCGLFFMANTLSQGAALLRAIR